MTIDFFNKYSELCECMPIKLEYCQILFFFYIVVICAMFLFKIIQKPAASKCFPFQEDFFYFRY